VDDEMGRKRSAPLGSEPRDSWWLRRREPLRLKDRRKGRMPARSADDDDDYIFSKATLREEAMTSHLEWVRRESTMMLSRSHTDDERREFLRRVMVAYAMESPTDH
jgi:hypothetical protein